MSLKLFSQEPAVPCYEQFIFLSYSWLLPLITVFPYETLSLSTEKIKDIGWDAVHDLITLIALVSTPIPPHPFHQTLSSCFKTTA